MEGFSIIDKRLTKFMFWAMLFFLYLNSVRAYCHTPLPAVRMIITRQLKIPPSASVPFFYFTNTINVPGDLFWIAVINNFPGPVYFRVQLPGRIYNGFARAVD